VKLPYREKVIACERGGTFKYFLARERVFPTWLALGASYGPLVRNETMHTVEIRGARLLFRSTLLGNPITVFRLPDCAPADVAEFHALIGLAEEP
jgi:hypothetical protein